MLKENKSSVFAWFIFIALLSLRSSLPIFSLSTTRMIAVGVCIAIALSPCLFNIFMTKNKGDTFLRIITGKNAGGPERYAYIWMPGFVISFTVRYDLFPLFSLVTLYTVLLILWSISFALSRTDGMLSYFCDLLSKFEKGEPVHINKAMSATERFKMWGTRINRGSQVVLFMVLLSLTTCPVMVERQNPRSGFVMFSMLLAVLGEAVLYYRIDSRARGNLYRYLSLWKEVRERNVSMSFLKTLVEDRQRNVSFCISACLMSGVVAFALLCMLLFKLQ